MAADYSTKIGEIREIVQSYRPGITVETPGPVIFNDALFIGLYGRTGCGKTSLINSIRCAANKNRLRRAVWLQAAGPENPGGHTLYRKRVEVTKNIAVVDNRGMDKLHTQGAVDELSAQLGGTRGYSEIVTWEESSKDLNELIGDRIDIAVFVFSALQNIEEGIRGLPNIISHMYTTQGHYPLAVITHVDKAKAVIVDEVKAVLRAQGLSDSCIFTVANVTDYKSKLKEEYELTLLELLDRCMNDGDQVMIFHHHKIFEDRQREAKTNNKEAKMTAELEIIKKKEHDLEITIENNRKAIKKAKDDARWCVIS